MKIFPILFLLFLLKSPVFSQKAKNITLNDTVAFLNSKSHTLYAGIDNYIEINKNLLPFKNFIVEVTRGMVMEDDKYFNLMVGRPGISRLNIYQYDSGDTVLCYSKAYPVVIVPSPYIAIDGNSIEKFDSIEFKQLCKKNCFEVLISDDFIDQESWYEIKSVTVGYSLGKVYVSRTCDGNSLSIEVLNEIKRLAPGKELAFVFTLNGSGDIFKRTEPFRLILK